MNKFLILQIKFQLGRKYKISEIKIFVMILDDILIDYPNSGRNYQSAGQICVHQ
jgi:hypothetical protein